MALYKLDYYYYYYYYYSEEEQHKIENQSCVKTQKLIKYMDVAVPQIGILEMVKDAFEHY